MKYLIVQDWPSTHGNHAGMVHMCRLLCQKYPSKYKMYISPMPRKESVIEKIIAKLTPLIYDRILEHRFTKFYKNKCNEFESELCDHDVIFLLDYHCPSVSQHGIAKYFKKKYPNIKLCALSHLTPSWYENHNGARRMILKWCKVIDVQLTLGSSLSNYFKSIGVPSHKLSTGFHYVDSEYYKGTVRCNDKLVIIAMGALQRDYVLLSEIVKKCPNVRWIICRGRKNVDHLFDFPNVKLNGYLTEDELRNEMRIADVSINVLEDTVGSNVIATSLSMGLAMIVSNVGSIKDYCNEHNSIFCENNANSFADAVNTLSQDYERVLKMRYKSLKLAQRLAIENVDAWFDNL